MRHPALMDSERLRRMAQGQGGLFTRAQAVACGFTPYQIGQRRRTGVWQQILGPVLAPAGLVVNPRVRDAAALLAIPDTVLAGPSAARWHNLPVTDERTYVLTGGRCKTSLGGVITLPDSVPDHDLLLIDGVLVTTRQRAIFDCLRILPEPQGLALLERALQKRWITMDELLHRTQARLGRRGTPALLRLIRQVNSGARSAAERLAVRLLQRAGVTGWRANVPIADDTGQIGDGDLVFEEEKLVVELDGWAYHSSPERFQRDRTRQNRLVAAGWTVLRFTWRDLVERPDVFVRTIQATRARLRAAR
jgi:hypothetical protein